MKRMISHLASASLACVAFAVIAHAAPTDGYTRYSPPTPGVQNRTKGCGGFSNSGGVFKAWVCAGEERVEQRWADWPNQNTYNQWQGDIRFDSKTQKTCIMQIKSNTGGEPIYIQVSTPGSIRNDNGSVFQSGLAGTWFRLNSLFNPKTGDGKAYINGSQKVSRKMTTSDRHWYFKNGTYNNGLPAGGKSTAEFKNVSHWRR